MINVGLDYHTKHSHLAILDEGGEKVWDGRVASEGELPRVLGEILEGRVLFEAGYGWPRLVRAMKDVDVELVMCHPVDNRKIAGDRRKSDRRDAENLAVFLKAEAFSPAYMAGEKVRDERQLIRGRVNMAWALTRVKNQIHSLLAYAGVPKESADIFAAKRRWYLETVELEDSTREILNSSLQALDMYKELIRKADARIREMNRKDPIARFLKTIPGVGDLTARIVLAEAGDINRFASDKSFACYSGLTPKQHQSGKTMRMMGLTKEGSSLLRWSLVQAAWLAIRMDPALQEFFTGVKARKNAKTAICAVARKLAVASWHVMTEKSPYRAQKPKIEGKPVGAPGRPPEKTAQSVIIPQQ
jgi:transposase